MFLTSAVESAAHSRLPLLLEFVSMMSVIWADLCGLTRRYNSLPLEFQAFDSNTNNVAGL